MIIKGVLFDLDNTLYNYDKCHSKAISKVILYLSEKTDLPENTLYEQFFKAKTEVKKILGKTASSHNRILYFQKLLENLNINPMKEALYLYHLYWDTFLEHISLEKGINEILESFSTLKLCLITDMPAYIQYKKIKKLNLDKYFSYLVISEEIGTEKPDEKNFLACLSKMKLNSSEVIMIGDDFAKDVIGATRLNIKTFWFDRKNTNLQLPENVIKFNNFYQLKELLIENNIRIG